MHGTFARKTIVGFAVIWIIVVTAALSSGLTLLLTDSASAITQRDAGAQERYERLDEVYELLMQNYYKPVEEDVLVQGAIDGMLASLEDQYTYYYTPDEMQTMMEGMTGEFVGVGILLQLTEDGKLLVAEVYDNGPAQECGMLPGDYIVAVDGERMVGGDSAMLDRAAAMIRGEKDTPVVITVERDGEEVDLTAYRDTVEITYVRYEMRDDGVGYVDIDQFYGGASDDLAEAIELFRASGATGIVVDLRDNPGGLLNVVLDCLDQLMPEGMLVYLENRAGVRDEYFSDGEYWDVPVAVLVNGNSASASEVFSGAVKDTGRGVIIGETTYGKGIVQTVVSFHTDGAGMQYTSEVYYTPAGNCIHGLGVSPDIECLDDPMTEADEALEAALDVLLGE